MADLPEATRTEQLRKSIAHSIDVTPDTAGKDLFTDRVCSITADRGDARRKTPDLDWGRLLVAQLEFYWDAHLWPRLKGLDDDEYFWEHDHIAALDDAGMRTPLGPKVAYFSADPMAALIVHVNRETMHHGGEIGLLRDLYLATGAANRHSRLSAMPR